MFLVPERCLHSGPDVRMQDVLGKHAPAGRVIDRWQRIATFMPSKMPYGI
jgi:hypothetical protein